MKLLRLALLCLIPDDDQVGLEAGQRADPLALGLLARGQVQARRRGQLGLLLGQAGKSLDLEFAFLDPAGNPPAQAVGSVLSRPFDSDEGLAMLAACDVVTYEFESVPVTPVRAVAARVAVRTAMPSNCRKRLMSVALDGESFQMRCASLS